MALKIKLHEAIGVGDLEVELQKLVPGLSKEDAHDFAKGILVAVRRTPKGVGPTVKIGGKTWTATNLAIDDGKGGIAYNEENGEYYYTWEAAMRVAKSIPGWHLPSAIEWNVAALVCGATEIPDDDDPNYNDYKNVQVLKDKLGVKLAGYGAYGKFVNVDNYALIWTSTEYDSTRAYYRDFSTGAKSESRLNAKSSLTFSVRLVKD